MCHTPEFKAWHKREVFKRTGVLDAIEKAVAEGMSQHNLRIEVKVDGKWTEVSYNDPLDIEIDAENLTAA